MRSTLAALVLASIASMPAAPNPETFALPDGVRVLVASGYARVDVLPDRVAIVLALVGTPIGGTGQLADYPAVVPGPAHPVSADDIVRAADALVVAGIPREAIRTRFVSPSSDFPRLEAYVTDRAPGPSELYDRHGPRAPIGMLLVDVYPLSAARMTSLAQAIEATIGKTKGLRAVDVVAYRRDCSDAPARRRATLDAAHNAELFARGVGLRVAAPLDVAVSERYFGPQVVCGSAEPRMPFRPQFDQAPTYIPHLTVSLSAHGAYRVEGDPSFADVAPMSLIATAMTANWHDPGGYPLVARSVQFPSSRPFVSARGTDTILVRPDAMIVSYRLTVVAGSDLTLAKMDRVAAGAGIPADHRTMRAREFIVRYDPADRDAIARVSAAVIGASRMAGPYGPLDALVATVPFVRDCEALRAPLVRSAGMRARLRAQAIADAAGVTLGAFAGISDAGFSTDAICGVGADASLDDLVQAGSRLIEEYGVSHAYGAQFTQSVAASWDIQNASSPGSAPLARWTPGYEQSNVDRAFVAEGGGPIGTGDAVFSSGGDCAREVTAAFGEATRAAMLKIHGRDIRALIDLGLDWKWSGAYCELPSSDPWATGPKKISVTASVMAVP